MPKENPDTNPLNPPEGVRRNHSTVNRNVNRGDLHLRPNKKIIKQLRDYCEQSGENMSDVFDLAIRNFLDKVWDPIDAKTNRYEAPIYNDKLLAEFYTKPHIIELYCQYAPGNKWKIEDDELGQRYNTFDCRLVEIGILQVLLSRPAGSHVKGFSDYNFEIDLWWESDFSFKATEMLLETLRVKYLMMYPEFLDLGETFE
jgi:hypothetical protein